jgi:hypothetical protein
MTDDKFVKRVDAAMVGSLRLINPTLAKDEARAVVRASDFAPPDVPVYDAGTCGVLKAGR